MHRKQLLKVCPAHNRQHGGEEILGRRRSNRQLLLCSDHRLRHPVALQCKQGFGADDDVAVLVVVWFKGRVWCAHKDTDHVFNVVSNLDKIYAMLLHTMSPNKYKRPNQVRPIDGAEKRAFGGQAGWDELMSNADLFSDHGFEV